MSYTIVKTDGQILTTIPDGTINTTSTSLGLPGRNYAGYGQYLDTDLVHITENFANSAPPPNPLRGQLWYNTSGNVLYVCPTDGETNPAAWVALASTSSGGTTTFGAVTVTGNLTANNITTSNTLSVLDTVATNDLTVTANATVTNLSVTGTTDVVSLNTISITSGANITNGSLVGTWSLDGGGIANSVAGTSLWVTNGNVVISGGASVGICTDNYYYANGNPINLAGTYNNGNVYDYLTGANAIPIFQGSLGSATYPIASITTSNVTTGGTSVTGQITGNWSLSVGSRLNATYADFAERFEADDAYTAGTVVELGGDKEITAVKYELSEDVFGVISDTAAMILNSGAGTDKTHPPVATAGRVQVRVTGKVKKGDRLVSAGKGLARAAKTKEANAFNTIGRAIADKTDEGVGYILAFVSIK